MQRFSHPSLIAAALAAALGALTMAAPEGIAGGALRFFALSLIPGAALALLIDRRTDALGIILSATLFSPVITAALATVALLSGSSPEGAGRIVAGLSTLLAIPALLLAKPARTGLSRRELFLLALLVASLAVITGWLPQTVEWWRVRSDAWFHVAVVEQIRAGGIPPTDPYFAGIPLQYMWAYHVYVLIVSASSGIDPFRLMALINIQSLAGLVVATLLFARALGARFPQAFASAAVVPLGMSALFWVFLPIRLAAAFTGEVRGMDEVARQFDLTPFTYANVQHLTRVWFNSDFYLDKFMVATAFSLSLGLFAACWYGAIEYLRAQRRFALFTVFMAMAGMLVFHTLVGVIMMAAIGGGAVVMRFVRRRYANTPLLVLLAPLGVAAAAFVACGPYLYSVMSAKDTPGAPFVFDIQRWAGVLISVALVLWLAMRQRSFLANGGITSGYFIAATACMSLFALLLNLPAANAYDKPAYLIYYPLAVLGAWTLADFVTRSRRRLALRWIVVVLLLAPVNVVSLAACYLMDTPATPLESERDVSDWVRANTDRDAIFIDRDSQVPLLVTGPRRYLCGRDAYAEQWHYDREEMRRRRHVRESILGEERFDGEAMATLGDLASNVYVVDRGGDGTEHASIPERFPEYFHLEFDNGRVRIYRVDRQACRDASSRNM